MKFMTCFIAIKKVQKWRRSRLNNLINYTSEIKKRTSYLVKFCGMLLTHVNFTIINRSIVARSNNQLLKIGFRIGESLFDTRMVMRTLKLATKHRMLKGRKRAGSLL